MSRFFASPVTAALGIVTLAGALTCCKRRTPQPERSDIEAAPVRTTQPPKPVSPRFRTPEANARPSRTVATRLAYSDKALPPGVKSLGVGDGWGCAVLHDDSSYCWVAPADVHDTRPVIAEAVPWLHGSHWSVGPDRICRYRSDGIRCVRAPEFMRFREKLDRAGDADGAPKSWGLESEGGSPLLDRTPVTHGAFRGCRRGFCWGAHTAPPSSPELRLCGHRQFVVPCAVAAEPALREFAEAARNRPSMIGDLYACFAATRGLRCIGASRDGMFGSREACPPSLLTAWPTATGRVPAPKAKCSREPVLVYDEELEGDRSSAGPRGLCFSEPLKTDMRIFGTEPISDPPAPLAQHCFGAVFVPDWPLHEIDVGLEDEPSACGIDSSRQVVCWGAGYSARGRPPRRVEFAVPKEGAVVLDSPGKYGPGCAIERNCTQSAEVLPACSGHDGSRSVSALLTDPKSREEQTVEVRGELGIDSWVVNTLSRYCPGVECCLPISLPIVVRDAKAQIFVDERLCSGDDSRKCCNAPALGQTVVARGRLTWRPAFNGGQDAWLLAEATLCEVR